MSQRVSRRSGKILAQDLVILGFMKLLRGLVHIFPLRFSLGVGYVIGTLAYFLTKRRNIAYLNLRAAFSGEKDPSQLRAIARASIRSLSMSGVELLKLPDLDQRYMEKHIKLTGLEKFAPSLKNKKGVIFLTAHYGNWELLNAAGSLLGYPMSVLARAQKHPRSNDYLNRLRASHGSQVIQKGIPIRQMLRSLNQGGIVGMLSDQDGGRNGVFVSFFKRLSSSPRGVVAFALRTKAAIFPVFIRRDSWLNHTIEVEDALKEPPDDLSDAEAEPFMLQQFARILERKIKACPKQWLWAHRRWKSTPSRSILILSDGKAGHLHQSIAACEKMKQVRQQQGISESETQLKIIEVRYRNKFFKDLLKMLCLLTQGHLPWKSALLQLVLKSSCYRQLINHYADIIISAGSSTLGVHWILKKENRAKSLVIMRPYFAPSAFEALLVSRHDQVKPAENIFLIDQAVTHVKASDIEKEGQRLKEEIDSKEPRRRGPCIGLLVGGEFKSFKFCQSRFDNILKDISRCLADDHTRLIVTTSRRTPVWAERRIKEQWEGSPCCPLLVVANEYNRKGIVEGILGACDILLVSAESVSMISEALLTGKKILVFHPWKKRIVHGKHRRFLDLWIGKDMIAEAGENELFNLLSESIKNNKEGESTRMVLRDEHVRVCQETLGRAVSRVM